MKTQSSLLGLLQRALKVIGKISQNVFNYLACREDETLNDRVLLRTLYNSGQIDESKYQDCCERSSKGDFDPEELQIPM
jgi:hypothetical protein